jgi:hypothetical protein
VPCGSVLLVSDKLVASGTVKGNPVSLLDSGEGENIRNVTRMVPHGPISWQFSDQVGAGHTGIAVNAHRAATPADVLEQCFVVEDVHSLLIIEKDPFFQHPTVLVEPVDAVLVVDHLQMWIQQNCMRLLG